jgi:hypothetical protein
MFVFLYENKKIMDIILFHDILKGKNVKAEKTDYTTFSKKRFQ